MMMILGYFIFSLHTAAYDEFSRATGQRWSSHERIGKRHTYQYLGVGEEEINLSGSIYPAFAGDPISLELIRKMSDEGEPHILISGTGKVFGQYIIEDLSEKRTLFFDNGAAQRIDFSLKLKRYDDDSDENRNIVDAIPVQNSI